MKRYNPYTKSRRHMTGVSYKDLSKVSPMKSSMRVSKKNSGRNSQGRITVRHQGGRVKRRFRDVDLRQIDKIGVGGRVESIEYDPNRSAFIMKILYKDGDRRYILAPADTKVGREIVSADKAPLESGNRLKLSNIPVGYFVHNIEMQPGKGGQIVRSAGAQAQVLAHEAGYTNIKLTSGETRKIPGVVRDVRNAEPVSRKINGAILQAVAKPESRRNNQTDLLLKEERQSLRRNKEHEQKC